MKPHLFLSKLSALALALSAAYAQAQTSDYQLKIPRKGLTVQASSTSTPTTPPAPAQTLTAQVSAASLDFSSVLVGQSASRQVLLNNTGTGTLSLQAPSVTGPEFSSTTSCGNSLAPGASCLTQVTFAPTARGSNSGSLTFASNATNGPLAVSLSGLGVEPAPTLTALTNANFGTVSVGSSATRQFQVRNAGNATLTGLHITISGAGLSLSGGCGASSSPISLEPEQTCTVTVTYAPTSAGTLTNAAVSAVSNSSTSPLSIALSGSSQGVEITNFGTYRAWSDGAFAQSCKDYRNPTSGQQYSGATGSGTYRVQPAGQSASNVYCDMTTDGGGWTRVAQLNNSANGSALPTVSINDLNLSYAHVLMVAQPAMSTDYATESTSVFKADGVNIAWDGLRFGTNWYFAATTPTWRGWGASSTSPFSLNLANSVAWSNSNYSILSTVSGGRCRFNSSTDVTGFCGSVVKVNVPTGLRLTAMNDIESLDGRATNNNITRVMDLYVR